ncbi:MAG: SIMPL domain-containing protein [Gammaproteobacteria bacterium]
MNRIHITLIFALCAAGLAAAPVVMAANTCTPHSVSVTGSGKAQATPGLYVFHIGISHRNTNVRAANDAVDKSAASAVKAARQAGLADKDIQSTNVSISPVYDSKAKPGEPQVFEVTRDITLTLRNPKHYAALVEGLIKAGVNRITNIEARPADAQAMADEALGKAVSDAKHNAQLIAQKLGVKLGPAIEVSVGGGVRPMPRMMAMSATASKTETGGYEPGQITTQAEVSARFELAPSGCQAD